MDPDTNQDHEVESAPSTGTESPDQHETPPRNESLERTLARIAVIHARMGFTSGDRTEEFIRDARDGGMYGDRW